VRITAVSEHSISLKRPGSSTVLFVHHGRHYDTADFYPFAISRYVGLRALQEFPSPSRALPMLFPILFPTLFPMLFPNLFPMPFAMLFASAREMYWRPGSAI
jgi:hypothetical protein